MFWDEIRLEKFPRNEILCVFFSSGGFTVK